MMLLVGVFFGVRDVLFYVGQVVTVVIIGVQVKMAVMVVMRFFFFRLVGRCTIWI